MMMVMNQIVHCIATCNMHLILQLQWRLAWTFKWMHCVFAAFSFSSFRSIIQTHTHREDRHIANCTFAPMQFDQDQRPIPSHPISSHSIWLRPIAINYGNLISLVELFFFVLLLLPLYSCSFNAFARFLVCFHAVHFRRFLIVLLVFIFIIIIINIVRIIVILASASCFLLFCVKFLMHISSSHSIALHCVKDVVLHVAMLCLHFRACMYTSLGCCML